VCHFYFYCTQDFCIRKEGARRQKFNCNARAENEGTPPPQEMHQVGNPKQAAPEDKYLSKPGA